MTTGRAGWNLALENPFLAITVTSLSVQVHINQSPFILRSQDLTLELRYQAQSNRGNSLIEKIVRVCRHFRHQEGTSEWIK